jgi:hypothetical protein
MRKLLAALTLAATAALTPTAAQASDWPVNIVICNSINSATAIYPHVYGGPVGNGLGFGQCGTYANGSGQVRVYVPGESYEFGQPNQGYGGCKNGPYDSNPPNVAKETYRDHWTDC